MYRLVRRRFEKRPNVFKSAVLWESGLYRNSRPLRPVSAIQRAVANCLRNMLREDAIVAFEIGDGATHFQYAIVGAGGETKTRHGLLQGLFTLRINATVFANHPWRHRSVGENLFSF